MSEKLVGDVQIGAFEVRSFFPTDPDSGDWAFEALMEEIEKLVSDLRREVREAGFARYPEKSPEPKEAIAARFLGAWPIQTDPKNVRGSHAYALVQMARAEYGLTQHMERGDGDAMWRSGNRMAAIAAWLLCRRQDVDRLAKSRRDNTQRTLKRPEVMDAREAGFAHNNQERRSWHDHARRIARDLRAKHPDWNESDVARGVVTRLKRLDPPIKRAFETVRTVLRK